MKKPLIGIGADVKEGDSAQARLRAFGYLSYVDAVHDAGAIPLIIPPQSEENLRRLVETLDGILLAGGADCDPAVYGEDAHPSVHPMDLRRQQNDLALARLARESGVPLLGVCLGLQVMTVAAGGKLIQDIRSEVETEIDHESHPDSRARHDVSIEPDTRLGAILGFLPVNVNSSHHQAVRTPGDGLRVNARASDGIIEGLEDPELPFYIGVQWHPEDMAGERSASALLGEFVKAAQAHAAVREAREGVTVPNSENRNSPIEGEV